MQEVKTFTSIKICANAPYVSPGYYLLDSAEGSFEISLEQTKGKWFFRNPSQSLEYNPVRVLCFGNTFTDEDGIHLNQDLVLDWSTDVMIFNPDGGSKFYVKIGWDMKRVLFLKGDDYCALEFKEEYEGVPVIDLINRFQEVHKEFKSIRDDCRMWVEEFKENPSDLIAELRINGYLCNRKHEDFWTEDEIVRVDY
jgi:hypothetical protein